MLMKKLQNNTLQKFLDNFIEELKYENKNRVYHCKKEFDIPFIISSNNYYLFLNQQ